MTEFMLVQLTQETPNPQWGRATVTFTAEGAKIHLSAGDTLRQIQLAARKLRAQGIANVTLSGAWWDQDAQWAFTQGFVTAATNEQIKWCGDETVQIQLQQRFEASQFARKLVNDTPENLAPVSLAMQAAKWLTDIGGSRVTYNIIEGDELLEAQWVGIHAVGRGSERPPAMLVLDFNPYDFDAPVDVALVGKGITFDSGGYSIKSSEGMVSMKCDMGGAATVTAALGLAIQARLSKRVRLFLCCAENLISGRAYKLGDILTYKNGVSVEVVNTDAEGRLVLADGLQAASESGAPLIIDAATLTGAAMTAVGTHYNAIFSPQMQLLQLAQQKAASVAERVWPLPLESWHQDMCPSPYADTANSRSVKGGGAGGASNAAGFLSRFVSPAAQWLHFDLAAAFADSASPLWSAGGTAHGVLTISELIKAS